MRQKRRVRFYVTASLLSADSVADRLISNDFATRIPPPAGEIPRKQPTPSASSPVASPRHEVKSTWREFFSDTQPPSSALPHIPPAGWTATPIIYAVPPTQPPALAYETNRLLPAPEELQPPVAQTAKTPRRRKVSTSREVTNQSTPDLLPAAEGRRKQKTNYAVVRSAKLRNAAIQIHGRNCSACGLSFDECYGKELAQGYIEIHHLNNIAAGVRNTDPSTDLAPLCGNCHAMADLLARHHPSPPRRIVELRNMLFPATRLPEKGMLPTAEVPKSPTTTKGGRSSKKKPKMDS